MVKVSRSNNIEWFWLSRYLFALFLTEETLYNIERKQTMAHYCTLYVDNGQYYTVSRWTPDPFRYFFDSVALWRLPLVVSLRAVLNHIWQRCPVAYSAEVATHTHVKLLKNRLQIAEKQNYSTPSYHLQSDLAHKESMIVLAKKNSQCMSDLKFLRQKHLLTYNCSFVA